MVSSSDDVLSMADGECTWIELEWLELWLKELFCLSSDGILSKSFFKSLFLSSS